MDNNTGRKVIKKSKKPFKSGNQINTIKGVIPHKILIDKMAYIFEEDDSYVRTDICEIIKENTPCVI